MKPSLVFVVVAAKALQDFNGESELHNYIICIR